MTTSFEIIKKKLGVYIHKNMDAETLSLKLGTALLQRPELKSIITPIQSQLETIKSQSAINVGVFNEIEELRNKLAATKAALNLAQKAYNIGNKVAVTIMDTKPVVDGSPLATGVSATLTPLEQSISLGATTIDELEKKIKEKQLNLIKASTTLSSQSQQLVSSTVTLFST